MGKPSTDAIGSAFEKYLADHFGWKLVNERRWQIEYGDTTCKTEIKYDRRLHQTGNLYFEGRESRTKNGKLMLSGVFKRGYRTYVIGDCSRVLFFKPQILRDKLIAAKERGSAMIVQTETSRGLIVPYDYMKWLAVDEYSWPVEPLICERMDLSQV